MFYVVQYVSLKNNDCKNKLAQQIANIIDVQQKCIIDVTCACDRRTDGHLWVNVNVKTVGINEDI